MQAKSERFELRLDQAVLDRIDGWRAQRHDVPSRSEAVRRLVEMGLDEGNPIDEAPPISLGERLIISMLADLSKPEKSREIDNDFVMSSIAGGHYWALEWELSGLLHDHVDRRQAVRETVDILDMWSFIEDAAKNLTDDEKQTLPLHARFVGFDGNNESIYLGIARFLIEKMGRFKEFKGRSLNSHMPVLNRYLAMYRLFEPMRQGLVGRGLSYTEIKTLLAAR